MKKRWAIFIAVITFAMGFFWIPLVGLFGVIVELRPVRSINFRHANIIGAYVQKFARTNDGRFPMHLDELITSNSSEISPEDWKSMRYRSRAHEKFDWLYFGAFHDTKHPPPILIASPEDVSDGKSVRIVVYPDGRCGTLSEEIYQAELRKMTTELNERTAALIPKHENNLPPADQPAAP